MATHRKIQCGRFLIVSPLPNDSGFYQIEVKLASTTVFVVLDLDDTVHVLTHERDMCGQ